MYTVNVWFRPTLALINGRLEKGIEMPCQESTIRAACTLKAQLIKAARY
jgi:hypothetical protein